MSQPIPDTKALDVYRPRDPRTSGYYKCVECIWIAVICTLASPGSNVPTVGMNICWHFLVRGAIFVHLVIKNG